MWPCFSCTLLKILRSLAAGVYAKARPKRQSAAHDCSDTAFEALFMFLESQQNITSIHHRDGLPVLDLEECMQHLKGQLAAQMNAGACLCRLAIMELQEAADADTGTELSFDYCDILLTQKGFKAVIEAYEAGIQVWLGLRLHAGLNQDMGFRNQLGHGALHCQRCCCSAFGRLRHTQCPSLYQPQ